MTIVLRAITQESDWLNTSRALTAEDLQGKIVLLDFWTFCCINCIHVMPDLKELEAEFGDNLVVIGVHSAKFSNERESENIRAAIVRHELEHPVVNDGQFHIWQRFGVRSWPSLVLINPLGKIESAYSGEGNKEALRSDIKTLISHYGASLNHSPLPIFLEKDKQPATLLSFPGKLAYGQLPGGRDVLFIADSGHHRILAVTLEGEILFMIGSGKAGLRNGALSESEFKLPEGLFYQDNTLFIADTGNHVLRKVDIAKGKVETLAGTDKQGFEREVSGWDALKTPLSSPWDITLSADKNHLIIAMAGTHQLWSYDLRARTVTVLAGNGRESIDDGRYPFNSLSQPSGVSMHGETLYFVDSETSSLRQWKAGKVETLIGTGLFDFGYQEGAKDKALLQHPLGLYADEEGIILADSYNHSLRYYDYATKKIHNWAGHGKRGSQDGMLLEASFNEPNAVIKIGSLFYVADTNNHIIRVIHPQQNRVETLKLFFPSAITPIENLPNLDKREKVTVRAGKPLTVQLQLEPGWEISAASPSWLILCEVTKEGGQRIESFSFDNNIISLPPLKKEGRYRLQGMFYYCNDQEGSSCLLKSYDWELWAEDGAGVEALLFTFASGSRI